MSTSPHHNDARVAVLVDCENSQPDILDYALKMAAQFGRVVLRRGYGNHTALIGKNTADIALDAMFDHRADKFCLVSSDSDFDLAYFEQLWEQNLGGLTPQSRLTSNVRPQPTASATGPESKFSIRSTDALHK